jgi:cyclopropane-fatty-acyl-phospholipid synthase
MNRLLKHAFKTIVRQGQLSVVDAGGQTHAFGDESGTPVAIRILDKATERGLVLDPELELGEAYMDGRLLIEHGAPYDLIALFMRNLASQPLPTWSRVVEFARRRLRHFSQLNLRRRAGSNARHHYDVDPRIYRLFLDRDFQYSCAYFADTLQDASDDVSDGLDDAQHAKKRLIAVKLNIGKGDRILDIGCGWGGLAMDLAEQYDAKVRGITLSPAQFRVARSRVRGLQTKVDFAVEDYRDTEGTFDRVVSVGMLEHVGPASYQRFFDTVFDRLADDGVALIHTIGRSNDANGITNPFIARYIFPGGYVPALSELSAAIERSGLIIGDIEVLRLHYAQTLRRWRQRFARNRAKAYSIAGERFCRMWEFYLAGSEAAFRYQNLVVFQIQLIKQLDAVPTTRDYLYHATEHPILPGKPRVVWAGGGVVHRFAATKH